MRAKASRKRTHEIIDMDARPPIVIGRRVRNGMRLPRAAPPGDNTVFDVVVVCEQEVCKHGIHAVLQALSSPHTAGDVCVLRAGASSTTCTKPLFDAAVAFLTAPAARACYDVYNTTACSFNVRMQYRHAFTCIKQFCSSSAMVMSKPPMSAMSKPELMLT